MPNPLRGEATVEGTDIRLTFDVSAFCMAEMALGQSTDAIVADFEAMNAAAAAKTTGAIRFPLLRALFWAGLQRHRECDLDAAADIMSGLDLGAVRDAITRGLLAAFGAAQEGEDRPRPRRKKAASTG